MLVFDKKADEHWCLSVFQGVGLVKLLVFYGGFLMCNGEQWCLFVYSWCSTVLLSARHVISVGV